MKKLVITLLVLLGIVHQDFWLWNRIEPLVFGFIPIGLAYHIGVSIAAGILWALAVHTCWPKDVEVVGGASPIELEAELARRARD